METAESWLIKGAEAYFAGNYEQAVKYFAKSAQLKLDKATAIYFLGLALAELARSKGDDEALYRQAFDKYDKIIQKKPDHANAFYSWGTALYRLARSKGDDETLYRQAFDKYYKATQLAPDHAYAFCKWGEALYRLAKIKGDDEALFRQAVDCFRQSNKDILGILVALDEDDREPIIQSQFLHPFFDWDCDDSRFFNEIIDKNKTDKDELKRYMDVYIKSISIISQLHVNNKNETAVAYYTEKTVAQKLLLGNSKFRLNVINYSNDPTEGTVLLNYFNGKKKTPTKENVDKEYRAFAGCFTFNYDSLNQFRLYGKEDGKEGTGLSLVFKDYFFSYDAKMPLKQDDSTPKNTQMAMKQDESALVDDAERQALFRCIYIDPERDLVVTVGQKDEHLFYPKKNESGNRVDFTKEKLAYKKYSEDITAIVDSVRDKMQDLKKSIKGLDPELVGQLLINLRYLTKHVAFKEEQECRIVIIRRLGEKEIHPVKGDDCKQMYIEYDPEVSTVDVKEIYFGPKVTGIELFQDVLKHKGISIPCKKSTNPLA